MSRAESRSGWLCRPAHSAASRSARRAQECSAAGRVRARRALTRAPRAPFAARERGGAPAESRGRPARPRWPRAAPSGSRGPGASRRKRRRPSSLRTCARAKMRGNIRAAEATAGRQPAAEHEKSGDLTARSEASEVARTSSRAPAGSVEQTRTSVLGLVRCNMLMLLSTTAIGTALMRLMVIYRYFERSSSDIARAEPARRGCSACEANV